MAVRQLLCAFLSAVLVWQRVAGIEEQHLVYHLADKTHIKFSGRGLGQWGPRAASSIAFFTDVEEEEVSLSPTDLQKNFLQKKLIVLKKNDLQKDVKDLLTKGDILANLLDVRQSFAQFRRLKEDVSHVSGDELVTETLKDLPGTLVDLQTKLTDLQTNDLEKELIDLPTKLTELEQKLTDTKEFDLQSVGLDVPLNDLLPKLTNLQEKLNDLREIQTKSRGQKEEHEQKKLKELRDLQKELMAQKLIAHWNWLGDNLPPSSDTRSFVSAPGFKFATGLAFSLYPDMPPQDGPEPHIRSVPKPPPTYYKDFGVGKASKDWRAPERITEQVQGETSVLSIVIDRGEDRSVVGMLSVYSRSKEAFEEGEDLIFIHLDAIVNGERCSVNVQKEHWKNVIDTWRVIKSNSLEEGTTSTKPDPLAVLAEYENILKEFGWTPCEAFSRYEAPYHDSPSRYLRMMPHRSAQVFESNFSKNVPTLKWLSALAFPLQEREASPANSAISQTRAMKRTKHKGNRKARKNRKRIRRNKK